MASWTSNKNSGTRKLSRARFLTGTDTKVVRVMGGGRGRFYWAVQEGAAGILRRVERSETELR